MFCDHKLCEEASEIFDNQQNLALTFSDEIKIVPMYKAEHIERNDNQHSEYETHFL